MSIRGKVLLGSALSAALAVAFFVLILTTSRQTAKQGRRDAAFREILQAVAELDLLNYEYLLHHEPRAVEQWRLRHESIAPLLAEVRDVEPRDALLVRQLSDNARIIAKSFAQVVECHARMEQLATAGAPVKKVAAVGATEDRWVAELMIASQSIISDASRLSERSAHEAARAQTSAWNLALIATPLFLLGALVMSLRTVRGVGRSARSLHDGIERIACGDLNHRIDMHSKDEIGELARAFDRMVGQLEETTVSRDKLATEVTRRREAQESLQTAYEQLLRQGRDLATANQQLQQQREELEVANEELQSQSEELGRLLEERMQAEEALVESEQRYRGIFENLNSAALLVEPILDGDGRLVDVKYLMANPAVSKHLRKDPEELVGRLYSAVFHYPGRSPAFEIYEKVLSTGEPYRGEILLPALQRHYDIAVYRPAPSRLALVLSDISARKQAEEALRKTAENLARSNRDLQHFAYVASHDLQEPLRTIRSYLQFIEKRHGEKLDASMRELFGFVTDGAARLQALILDLLAYSRVTNADQEFAAIDSGKALEGALNALGASIEAARATVTQGPLPMVKGDPSQISLIFQNLVGNAIKFIRKDEPPSVHISAGEQNGQWLFSVRDNGIGIEEKYYDRIFTIFQRLHTSAEYKGSGVGLAICKRIIERHGGEISLESEPGKGTSFIFTLPKA